MRKKKMLLAFFFQTDMYIQYSQELWYGTVPVLGIWYLYCVGPNRQRMPTAG